MSRSALTLSALSERIARPRRAWRNRFWARTAGLGKSGAVAGALPEPLFYGDAERGLALASGRWPARGRDIDLAGGSIWDAGLSGAEAMDRALERDRQAFLWLDDLAAFGSRAARATVRAWTADWIARFGRGGGPGWQPEVAGRRLRRWCAHARLLTQGLEPSQVTRFWRAVAAEQRYLIRAWRQSPAGLAQLRALGGLVLSGLLLPHAGHADAVTALGPVAEALIDAEGCVASRAPDELAEALILLIWLARALEDAGQHAASGHLAAIARAVPVLRPLRLGDGGLARFHGSGPGAADRLDQALAELRLGVQARPRLAMGYCRLAGGRLVLVMDGAAPPGGAAAARAHAGTLAFEMSIGRQPVVVNAGSGCAFGPDWDALSRQTAAHSTVEVDGQSSAGFETASFAARTFGAQLTDGPTLVSVRQAQDASGMWLLATHDGYVRSHGLLHERRLFVDARSREARGEEILSVTDARARGQFNRAIEAGSRMVVTARFHLHPAIEAAFDAACRAVDIELPSGELWQFRAAGGEIDLEPSIYFDPQSAQPVRTTQVVVRTEVVEYLGQITWSFGRMADAPRQIGVYEDPAVPDDA